jgi:hypothetical protein
MRSLGAEPVPTKQWPLTTKQRFLTNVDKRNGCWLWQTRKDRRGYGQFFYKRGVHSAHRISYMIFKGEIGEGLFVCHKCDNPPCVNPDHLFLGTAKDNMHDMLAKGRRDINGPRVYANLLKTHCPKGHPYDTDNTYKRADGRRDCRICESVRKSKSRVRWAQATTSDAWSNPPKKGTNRDE